MSIMVGTGRGATAGVLIRNAEALETLAKVDILVVDKTGTLTEGKPRLMTVAPLPDVTETELLRLAAGLSNAASIRWRRPSCPAHGTRESSTKVEGFRSLTGKGSPA